MLHVHPTRASGPFELPAPRPNIQDGWAEIAAFLRRRARVFALTPLACIVIASLYCQVAAPSYTAATEIFLDASQSRSSGVPQQRAILGDPSSDSANVESQVEVLQSGGLAMATVEQLQLTDDPEFTSVGFLATYIEPLIQNVLGTSAEAPEVSSDLRKRRVAAALMSRVSVRRVGVSYVLEVRYTGRTAEGAARIAAGIIDTYVSGALAAKQQSIQKAKEWLEFRLSELEEKNFLAERALRDFRAEIGSSPGTEVNSRSRGLKIMQLEAAAASARSIYNSFLLRYTDALQNLNPLVDARVISPASPPMGKSSPKPLLIIPAAGFLGTVLGLVFAFVLDQMDRTFRTQEQVSSVLGLPCLGLLPRVAKRQIPFTTVTLDGATTLTERVPAVARKVVLDPESTFSQNLRSTKAAVVRRRASKDGMVVGITSATPREGRSTVAASLAQLLATAGHSTLLLNLDPNSSGRGALFPHIGPGVSELIVGEVPTRRATWVDELTGLRLLAPEINGRLGFADDVIGSEEMDLLLSRLRGAYDYIVVDLPALTRAAEVDAAQHLIDSLIVVVGWGTTAQRVVQLSLKAIGQGDRLIGVLLNNVDMRRYRKFSHS